MTPSWPPDLQRCEIINEHCFKLLHCGHVVTQQQIPNTRCRPAKGTRASPRRPAGSPARALPSWIVHSRISLVFSFCLMFLA